MASLDSLPPPPLPAVPAAPDRAPSPDRPAIRHGRDSLRGILTGLDSPATETVAQRVDQALASAPSDSARTVLRSEIARCEDDIRMAALDGPEELSRLIERIIAQSARVSAVSADTPPPPAPAPAASTSTSPGTLPLPPAIPAALGVAMSSDISPSPLTSPVSSRSSYVEVSDTRLDQTSTHNKIRYYKELIDNTGARDEIERRLSAADRAEIAAAAQVADPVARARAETRVYARVVAHDEAIRSQVIAKSPSAYHALAREFPDIDFPPVRQSKPSITSYERELMGRVGGKSETAERAGDRITFDTGTTEKDGTPRRMTLDTTSEPPSVLAHGPNGTLVPVNLNGNRTFDRAYGLMRQTETLKTEIENLKTKRDALIEGAVKLVRPLGLEPDSAKSPVETIDDLIERIEIKLGQDREGNPPAGRSVFDSSMSSETLIDQGLEAVRAAEAPAADDVVRRTEKLIEQLKGLRDEVARIEEEIRLKTAEKSRVDAEKNIADQELATIIDTASKNAEANMAYISGSGADLLRNEGVIELVRLLNQPNVRASIKGSVVIDFSQPLKTEQQLYIATGMGLLF
ncbi:MAG TPA: hypothetical protein PK765_02685 [bacterium]|nr:hypothetical protein [bacterium]